MTPWKKTDENGMQWVTLEEFDQLRAENERLENHITKLECDFIDLGLEMKRLRAVVEMFLGYTTPEDCPTPHKMAREALDSKLETEVVSVGNWKDHVNGNDNKD